VPASTTKSNNQTQIESRDLRRDTRWAEELAGIDFRIHYRPGTQNGKPDALSRCTEYRPEKGGVEKQPITTILRNDHFTEPDRQQRTFVCSSARLRSLPARRWNPDFTEEIRKAAKNDPDYQQVAKQEAEADKLSPKTRKDKEIRYNDGLLYRKNLLWVPNELVQWIMESEHDTKVARHMGQDKNIELIRRNFWWPRMNERIIDFVRSCPECQRNKASRHQPYGLSSPLELPYAPWQLIAMDFITDLPPSEGRDQLWVVIPRKWSEGFAAEVKEKGKTDKEYQQAWGLIKEVVQEEPASDSQQAREETGDPHEVSQRGRKERKPGEVLKVKDGLLYRKGMLWIPEDENLIGTILESEHHSKIAGHMGQDKTIKLIRRNFWWPGMDKRIID